ncbi:MAG TPA: hypothetical protein VGK73_06770 [Polyangiaceae bacterium]
MSTNLQQTLLRERQRLAGELAQVDAALRAIRSGASEQPERKARKPKKMRRPAGDINFRILAACDNWRRGVEVARIARLDPRAVTVYLRNLERDGKLERETPDRGARYRTVRQARVAEPSQLDGVQFTAQIGAQLDGTNG